MAAAELFGVSLVLIPTFMVFDQLLLKIVNFAILVVCYEMRLAKSPKKFRVCKK